MASSTPASAIYPSLKPLIVLLTGIGQSGNPTTWGNGAATALQFARQGARVYGCDLNIASAEHNRDRILADAEVRAAGGSCVVGRCDVTVEDEVREMVGRVLELWGRIDVLINNVGVSMPGGPVEMSPDVWRQQTDVNLTSVYLCCHFVLPIMEKQGKGVVINISTIAGMRYIGKPQIAYSATKAAVIQFTKATAVLYAKRGVRMNVVVPGLMHTPLIEALAEKYYNGDLPGLIAKRNAAVPMGMGDAFDVANAVLFLASDQAKYITGQKLVVDGGITSETKS